MLIIIDLTILSLNLIIIPSGCHSVVGAGTSGCVLAAKLSEDPSVSVLLIEAGRRPPWYSWIPLLGPALQGSDSHDWRFRTVPQKSGAGALVNNVIIDFKKNILNLQIYNQILYRNPFGRKEKWLVEVVRSTF